MNRLLLLIWYLCTIHSIVKIIKTKTIQRRRDVGGRPNILQCKKYHEFGTTKERVGTGSKSYGKREVGTQPHALCNILGAGISKYLFNHPLHGTGKRIFKSCRISLLCETHRRFPSSDCLERSIDNMIILKVVCSRKETRQPDETSQTSLTWCMNIFSFW